MRRVILLTGLLILAKVGGVPAPQAFDHANPNAQQHSPAFNGGGNTPPPVVPPPVSNSTTPAPTIPMGTTGKNIAPTTTPSLTIGKPKLTLPNTVMGIGRNTTVPVMPPVQKGNSITDDKCYDKATSSIICDIEIN